MYSDLEENFGLLSHAMDILEQGVKKVTNMDFKFELYNLMLAKVTQYFGIMKAREYLEKAFEILTDAHLIQLGLRFAKLERKLGELDRARSIYEHLSQFCNPHS